MIESPGARSLDLRPYSLSMPSFGAVRGIVFREMVDYTSQLEAEKGRGNTPTTEASDKGKGKEVPPE